MSEPQDDGIVEMTESQLNEVQGGVLIGLLLPAVQKVREAANRTRTAADESDTGLSGGLT